MKKLNKQSKTLLILLIVLIVLCIIIFSLTKIEDHKEKIKAIDDTIVSFEVSDIIKLSFNKLSFYKEDDTWYYEDDKTLPISTEKIEEALDEIKAYQASFVIEEADDLSNYGLDNPKMTIQYNDNKLILGGFSSMDSQRYFSIDNGNVYLAKKDVLDSFKKSVDDFVEKQSFPEYKQLEKIVLTGENNVEIIYKKDAGYCYTDEYTYYLNDNGTYKALSEDKVNDFYDGLSDINLDEYTMESAENYGFSNPTLTLETSGTEGDSVKLLFAIKKSLLGVNEKYYMMAENGKLIYELDEDTYKKFSELDFDDLRPDEVLNLDWDDVSDVEAKIGTETYTLNTKKEEEKYKDVRSNIDDLEYTNFEYEDPKEKVELELKINIKNSKYSPLDVVFYRYDGESCLATFNGEKCGLVTRSSVIDLVESIYKQVL